MPECPVCLLAFDTSAHCPMLLGCEHSLCLVCVTSLSFPLSCPLCRKVTSGSVADLKQNPKLYPKQDSCVECKAHASCFCASCGPLCEPCSSKIHSFKSFSSHVIVPVNKKASVIPYCEEHDKEAELYCPFDSCIICTDCKDSGTHKGHANIMSLKEAALKKTSELQSVIDRVDTARNLDHLVDVITQEQRVAKTMLNRARNQLRAYVQEFISRAHRIRSEIEQEEQKLDAAFHSQRAELARAQVILQDARAQVLMVCEGNKAQILRAPKIEFPRIEVLDGPCFLLTKVALDLPELPKPAVQFHLSATQLRAPIEELAKRERLDVLDELSAVDRETGERIDKAWRTAVVVKTEGDSCLIHFDGWSAKWREWIPRGSARLAPLGTHTKKGASDKGPDWDSP